MPPEEHEIEEVDVTQLVEKMHGLEEKISSQETKITALETSLATAVSELASVGASVDRLAEIVGRR